MLRNHRLALVRRDGRWETIQSATQALAVIDVSIPEEEPVHGPEPEGRPVEPPVPAAAHGVRFFEEPEYPAEDIGRYLQEGLAQEAAVLIFATEPHLAAITAALQALGADVPALIEQGRLVTNDAERVVRAIVAPLPDEAAFQRHVGEEVNRAAARYGRVRVYGEIVDVLARWGEHPAAIQLERWWNQLLADARIALLCGYGLDGFADAKSVPAFRRVCQEHAHIEPASGDGHAQGKALAELEQMTMALRGELRERLRAEREQYRLRQAENASRVEAQSAHKHIASLQQLTAALSEATTLAEVSRAVVNGLQRTFEADFALLALALDDGTRLLLTGQAHDTASQPQVSHVVPGDAPLPIVDAYRSGRPLWLSSPVDLAARYPAVLEALPQAQVVGCEPLALRGRALGAIGLVYRTPRRLVTRQRALLEDYVGQIALAVERALTYEDAQRARARLQLLADAGRHIAQAQLDLEQVLNTVVREATRAAFAHGCAVELRDDGEMLSLAALHHANPQHRAAAERLLHPTPAGTDTGVTREVAHTGAPVRLAAMEEIARRFGATQQATGEHPFSGAVVVPLLAAGKIIGTLTALRDFPSPPFTVEDEQWVQDFADRAALSIENALLYDRARRERERAESANSTKDEFLAMLGHELRNPLSPILTAVQLIRLRAGEQCVKERAIIERQVHHMVRLVDDLLDVSRITHGKIELERVPMELAEVVAHALEIASPLIDQRHHRVVMSVPATGLRIEADAARLAQVIANLLINAAKYTPPGGFIKIAAQAQTGKAVLRVRDNGIGIDPDLLPRIFELFAQGKQGRDRAQGGLGLGLTIARNLAEMHGGSLRAQSDGPGKGAELTLELPLLSGRRAPAARARRAETGPTASGRKILVVDDNADAADMLAEVLRMFGYAVEVVYDGPSALAIAEGFRPEIALLDIGLPAMDGLELARRLKSLLRETAPKLIALTGYGQAADRHRSKTAGFDDHLTKPVDFQHLRIVLDRLFAAA